MIHTEPWRMPPPKPPRRHLWWQVLATLGAGATLAFALVAIGWFL